MWLLALLLLPTSTDTAIGIQPLSGAQVSGTLVALDSKQVAVNVDGSPMTYNLRDLMAVVVRPAPALPPSDANTYIQLVDGSQIVATAYRVTDRKAEVQIGGRIVQIDTRNIRSVRFHAPSDALDTQWREIVESESQGDVIVLRRSNTALDQLEGLFQNVTAETVEFVYDDEQIPVKRTKLEGMVYYHPAGRDLPEAICRVYETSGTSWQARSVELKEGQLLVVTRSGTKCELPWDAITRLDFSSGNVAYLGDMEFELAECTPFIASQVSAERIKQLYAPRRDNSFEGEGLWLSGEDEVLQFDKGLAIHSRSLLVYRLTEPYRRLTAIAGIDSRLQGRGNLVLVVEGDNRELFRETISGKDPPRTLDLNIEGIRRLRILVDFGESLDVADHLNLCNARIIK